MFEYYRHTERELEKDIEAIHKDDNALLIAPSQKNKTLSRTTNSCALKETYRMGIESGSLIEAFLQ